MFNGFNQGMTMYVLVLVWSNDTSAALTQASCICHMGALRPHRLILQRFLIRRIVSTMILRR
jgi:hypothetical protein